MSQEASPFQNPRSTSPQANANGAATGIAAMMGVTGPAMAQARKLNLLPFMSAAKISFCLVTALDPNEPMKIDEWITTPLNSGVKEVKEVKVAATKTQGAVSIGKFDPQETKAPGYARKTEQRLKSLVAKKANKNIDEMGSFSLCKPAVYQDHCIVATDAVEDQHHWIMCVNTKAMHEDPIVECVHVSEHIRDVRWIAQDTVLCASGEGHILVYGVSSDWKLKHRGTIGAAHSDEIREMAVNLANPCHIASGGFDQKLCIMDLSHAACVLDSVHMEAVIGSVKWPICNQSVCVSCTLDSGNYRIYDLRQKITKPTYQAVFGKTQLYTHERYSDYHVLLGFGDGTIYQIDMRASNKLLAVQDPYVQGIGGIEFNSRSQSFVVSGFTDFTVWNCGTDASSNVWSHSVSSTNKLTNQSNYSTAAVYLPETTTQHNASVLVSDSVGALAIYDQDFAALSRGKA